MRISLTIKMLLITAVVSLVVWGITDQIQTRFVDSLFRDELAERFSLQAEEQRIKFDRYVKGHHQVAKLFASSNELHDFVGKPGWDRKKQIVVHRDPPAWLPPLSVMRSFIPPRLVYLLDKKGRVVEVYNAEPDRQFRDNQVMDELLLTLSRDQGYLTNRYGKPNLVASRDIRDRQGNVLGILMLESPLDEQFLRASQNPSVQNSGIIALMGEVDPVVLVSSDESVIPSGTRLDSLKEKYMIVGQGFFDYGAADVVIKLTSFIPTNTVEELTREVVGTERTLRSLSVVALVAAFSLLMYVVTRRIQQLSRRVEEFSSDMKIEQATGVGGDQITELENQFRELAKAVRTETEELERQALHDPLTDLPNRKLLQSRIQQEILRSQRSMCSMVLIVSDLDRFKEINDTLGHHIGDLVLQQAAQRIAKNFRKTDTVARLGGDEFGILLSETSLPQAVELVKKLAMDFAEPFVAEDHNLSLGISMGIVEFPTHGDDVTMLMQRADIAMYIAKRTDESYAVYDAREDSHSIKRLALMTDLRNAITNQELELHYQPILDFRTGAIVMLEALLRWEHPRRGQIPPDDFIPLAEQTGLIKPLTKWVVETAFMQSNEWNKRGLDITVSVNISVNCLYDSMIHNTVSSMSKTYGESIDRVSLEITESDIMIDPIRARETLLRLNQIGLKISIDDFGTGYSSLSYLKRLPAEIIKIDQSFVAEMTKDENDAVIVRATIDMAHNLGMKVTAEGVEDRETREMLEEFGCDFGQGYLFGRPVPADKALAYLGPAKLLKGFK